MIMKLLTLTPHESRMCPIDFGVKGQGHWAWLIVTGFLTIIDSVIKLWSWNFVHLLLMNQGCALLILRSKGQRSRSRRMINCKWFPDYNWLCNQLMIMKLHTHAPHESRMCSFDFFYLFISYFLFLCPRHKMARGHLVFALSVIPSFRPSVIPSHQILSSQLLLHPCMDLNETWYRCCTTSLEVHVGR